MRKAKCVVRSFLSFLLFLRSWMRPVDGDETINELLGVIFEKNLKYSIVNFNKLKYIIKVMEYSYV